MSDERKSRQSHGRRWYDDLTSTVTGVGKLAVAVISTCLLVYMAGIGAYTVGYAKWQEHKSDIARNATPPAFTTRESEKKQ